MASSVRAAASLIVAAAVVVVAQHQRCHAFRTAPSSYHQSSRLLSAATDDQDTALSSNKQLDKSIAQQFTIQVCTSTSCCKKLQNLGLDQYHLLGELYEKAKIDNIETDLIIEDGGCRGGKNCKLGPCVAVLHEDFDGSVALEGMGQSEFNERVFHGVSMQDDVDRVWGCVANAIDLMADEENET